MTPTQLKLILQSAVIAALPVAVPMVEANNNSPPSATTNRNPVAQPCRTPVQLIPQKVSIKQHVPGMQAVLATDECLLLCRTLIERKVKLVAANAAPYNTVIGMTDLNINQCETSIRPDPMFNGGNLVCEATYQQSRFQYTAAPGCYHPNIFQPRRRVVPGRMPAGTSFGESNMTNVIGHYFADMASMETAAITAFRYLLRELEAYQAPAELIQMAREAIQEETEHAEMAGLLAQAYDTAIPRVLVDDFQLRSLAVIALENAVEGCVNETFAAASGYWQWQCAEHDTFRAVIGHITEEESKHAALSWAIHEWAMPQLTPAEQAHIWQAQSVAIRKLESAWEQEEHPLARHVLGLPDQTETASLLRELRAHLWDERIGTG